MAMEINAAPPPPRLSTFSSSSSTAASLSTVGALLAKASAAAAPSRECPSPRSLLSRILHRAAGVGGGGGGGFGCRGLRLPRYCSSGAAKEDATAEHAVAEADAPKVVARRESSPRSSLGKKAAEGVEVSPPASLGLGASLVLLLSKSAAELNRMAELRAQMERIVIDGANRSSASDDHAGGESGALSRCSRTAAAPACGGGNAAHHDAAAAAVAMDQMEAELEAELTSLQFATPRRDHQLETTEPKSDDESTETHAATFAGDDDTDGVDDDTLTDDQCDGDEEEEDESEEGGEEEEEEETRGGGVSARELERRLHELLQTQHESRIAELETELERAKRKLQEKEREVCWWRNTAKLVTRHKDDSRLR